MPDPSFDFGSRKRKIKSNGDDFEDFVFECLTISGEMPGLEKRLARGRDGAVDLADRFGDPGGLAIAECKFIGSGGLSQASECWKRVFDNLKNNLPALSAAPATRQASPYRAWLDRDRPVASYRFCLSIALSDADMRKLEKIIQDGFAELVAAGVDELRYLATTAGAVRVLRWDWFHRELERHPALAFRWFRGLPKGIELFDAAAGGEASFRAFLSQGSLRYFSRDEYAKQPGAARIERREGDLIADLAGNAAHGLLISGPGGVGKTRLAHELASGLGGADHGFDVYQLGRSADYASLETLAGRYSQPASILLMADYAEAIAKLADIAEAAEYLEAEAGHRVRIIATCRSSATNQVHGSLAALRPKQAHLASPMGGEEGFAQWVTRSILALERFPDADALERVCHGVPVLAAFAVYLFRRHRAAFDNQFGGLLNADSFGEWAQQRIKLLLGGGGQAQQQMLARIGLALPCSRAELNALAAGDTNLLSRLRTDRWIEDDGALCYAAHDVLADALVGRWIFEAPHAATDRVIDLLDEAAGRDALLPALIALERQAQDSRFGVLLDGATIAAALHARLPAQAPQWAGVLLDGRLLDFDEKLALLENNRVIRSIVETSRALDVALCRLAGDAASLRKTPATTPQLDTLAGLLELAWQAGQFSNLVLRRAYAVDPVRFRDRALRNLDDFPHAETTHYLLAQLLRSGEPPERLRQQAVVWLERNGTTLCASFVYAAWLNADGEVDVVRAGALAWMAKYGERIDAQFLYAAWLKAGCDIDFLTGRISTWIQLHGARPDAQFLYSALLNAKQDIDMYRDDVLRWLAELGERADAAYLFTACLNAGVDCDSVRNAMLKWAARHQTLYEASFILHAWLDATGDADTVHDWVRAWIASHGAQPEAQFVYAAWLNAKGSFDAVRDRLLVWIHDHGLRPEAQFVYVAWLNAGGCFDTVRARLLAWIEDHGLRPDARYVFEAWLKAGGEIDPVQQVLPGWMDSHGELQGADNVYKAWLEANGDYALVAAPLARWVSQWGASHDFVFLSKTLSKRRDVPESILIAIASWCADFPFDEDSLYRLSSLLVPGNKSFTPVGVARLAGHVDRVFAARTTLTPMDRVQCWSICYSLAHHKLFNLDPFGTTRAIATIVCSGNVFAPGLDRMNIAALEESAGHIALIVLNGLRNGELCVVSDNPALSRFSGWIRATSYNVRESEIFLRRFDAEFPSPLWR